MNMVCEQCRGPIGRQQGRGGRRRFCETCRPTRIRKDRPVPRSVARQIRPVVPVDGREVSSMEEATRLELEAAGVPLDCVAALCALILARAVDRGDDTVPGMIAAIKEHSACMAWAMQSAAPVDDQDVVTLMRRRLQTDQ